ncbi:MAG: hypothetical protein AAF441_16750 [Pseudomonadota bacterium]
MKVSIARNLVLRVFPHIGVGAMEQGWGKLRKLIFDVRQGLCDGDGSQLGQTGDGLHAKTHPEEPSLARRLEGWTQVPNQTAMLRGAALRLLGMRWKQKK